GGLPAALPGPHPLRARRLARRLGWRASDGLGARPLLRRLLLGVDARALRARRDEPRLDGSHCVPDLRPEGASARRPAGARGLCVVMATHYSDDVEGSPWSYARFVDERADALQGQTLWWIFSGALGGTVLDHFPWAWKPSDPLGFDSARIEIDHTPGGGWFRV